MPVFMFAMRRVIMLNEQGCLLVRQGGREVGLQAILFVLSWCLFAFFAWFSS